MFEQARSLLKEKINTVLFCVFSIQGIFLLTLLSKLTDGTHADPYAVCWYYFQNCAEWIYMPAPGTATSVLVYTVLVSLNLAACLIAVKGYLRRAIMMSLPLSVWIAQHVFIASYSAGHAYDYIFLVLYAVYVAAAVQSKSNSVSAAVATAHIVSALYMVILISTGNSALGRPYVGQYAYLAPLLSVLPVIAGLSFVFFFFQTTKAVLRGILIVALLLYIYGASALSLEWRYAVVIVPHLIILFFLAERISIRKNNVYVAVVLCLVICAQIFQGVRVVTQGGMCLRPHLGIATSYTQAQCVSVVNWVDGDGVGAEQVFKTPRSRPCWCDPYVRWYKAKQLCERTHKGNISWSLYTSVRNMPAKLVAQTSDLCSTSYRSIGKQDWQGN